jgi:hypothetical protein
MDRLTELEHHVVRHVDRERDRPHPGELDAAREPARRRRRGVEPLDLEGHEPVAARLVVETDGIAVARLGGLEGERRVGEGQLVGGRGLAGDTADRQRVGTVGVDLELEHDVAQVQQRRSIGTGLGLPCTEHDDAGVVVAETQLAS